MTIQYDIQDATGKIIQLVKLYKIIPWAVLKYMSHKRNKVSQDFKRITIVS